MERSESRASGEAPYGTLLPHGVMDTTPHAQGLATALASVPRMVSTGRKRSDDEAHNNGATSYPLRSDKQVDSTDESPSKIVQLHRRGAMPLSAERGQMKTTTTTTSRVAQQMPATMAYDMQQQNELKHVNGERDVEQSDKQQGRHGTDEHESQKMHKRAASGAHGMNESKAISKNEFDVGDNMRRMREMEDHLIEMQRQMESKNIENARLLAEIANRDEHVHETTHEVQGDALGHKIKEMTRELCDMTDKDVRQAAHGKGVNAFDDIEIVRAGLIQCTLLERGIVVDDIDLIAAGAFAESKTFDMADTKRERATKATWVNEGKTKCDEEDCKCDTKHKESPSIMGTTKLVRSLDSIKALYQASSSREGERRRSGGMSDNTKSKNATREWAEDKTQLRTVRKSKGMATVTSSKGKMKQPSFDVCDSVHSDDGDGGGSDDEDHDGDDDDDTSDDDEDDDADDDDDDGDDDAPSDASDDEISIRSVKSSVKSNSKARSPRDLPTATLTALKNKMVQSEVDTYQEQHIKEFVGKTRELKEAIKMTTKRFIKRRAKDEQLRVEDEWWARMIMATLDNQEVEVQNFRNEIVLENKSKASPDDLDVDDSGYMLWQFMHEFANVKVGAQKLVTKAEFSKKVFIKQGMSYPIYKKSVHQMINMYERQPESAKYKTQEYTQLLLDKMPTSVAAEVHKQRVSIEEREARGKAPKYTFKQLVEHFALHVVGDGVDAIGEQATINGANAYDDKKRRQQDDDKKLINVRCTRCGLKGHKASSKDKNGKKLCKGKCEDCGSTMCTGTHKQQGGGAPICVGKMRTLPPLGKLLNGCDEPMPENVYKKIEQHKKELEAKRGATNNSLQTQTSDQMATSGGIELHGEMSMMKMSVQAEGLQAHAHNTGEQGCDMPTFSVSMINAKGMIVNLPEVGQDEMYVQSDGGADCCWTSDPRMRRAAHKVINIKDSVKVVGGKTSGSCRIVVRMRHVHDHAAYEDVMFLYRDDNESEKQTIVSQPMLRLLGFRFTEGDDMIWPKQHDMQQPVVLRASGFAFLSFVRFAILGLDTGKQTVTVNAGAVTDTTVLTSTERSQLQQIDEIDGRASGHDHGEQVSSMPESDMSNKREGKVMSSKPKQVRIDVVLWAAKMNLGATALNKLKTVTNGVSFGKIDAETAYLIDNNAVRKRALEKRSPVSIRKPPKDRTLLPGHEKQIDGLPMAQNIKSPLDGSVYALQMIDVCSSLGSAKNVKKHRVEDWQAYILEQDAWEQAGSRKIRIVWMDADAAARAVDNIDGLKSQLAAHGIDLRVSAGGHHERVGKMEVVSGDGIERRAEMMLRRVSKGANYILDARMQAWWLFRSAPLSDSDRSPLQQHTGKAEDYGRYDGRGGVPIWGVRVSYILTESDRDVRGADRSRSGEGTFMYIDEPHGKYVILSETGSKITRTKVTPLNELAVARVGLDQGAAMVDVDTQIVPDGAPPLVMPPTKVVMKAQPVKYVTVIDESELSIGDKTRHWWPGKSGDADGKWYHGEIVRIEKQADGAVHHVIVYDGEKGEYPHNLAKDRSTGTLPWFRVPAMKVMQNKPIRPAVEPERRSNRIAKTQLHAQCAAVLNAAVHPVSVFHAMAYQMIGDKAMRLTAITAEQVDEQFDDMIEEAEYMQGASATCSIKSMAAIASTEVNVTAAKLVVKDIITPMGIEKRTVPQSTTQVMNDKYKDRWLEAARKAYEVGVLASPDTRLVTEHEMPEGAIWANGVMTYTLKDDDGKLPDKDAEKARLSYDAKTFAMKTAWKGMFDPSKTYSTNPDPTLKRWFISSATRRGYTIIKGDVKNAYRQALTDRGKRWIRVPEFLREHDESGRELYIELGPYAFWGERPSGHDWDETFYADRKKIGWLPCDGVPGLWTYGEAMMIGEVDDFLVAEPAANEYAIAARTIHLLIGIYRNENNQVAVTWEAEPRQYAGWQIAVSDDLTTRTLRVTQKVINAAREHIPAVVDGDKEGIKKLDLLKGKKLRDAL